MSLRPDSTQTPHPWLRRLLFLPGVLVWFGVTHAQNFRTVGGTVKDQTGRALNGAIVEIEDKSTLQVRSYRTQQDGAYHFGILFPDLTYHLRASYGGVSSRGKLLSKFSSHEATTIDFTIDLRKRK